MYFKQFYLGCLAHASYLIGSDGEAAVIDPQRDVAQYLDEAARHGLQIKHVIETHLHADFVSGHRELAAATGARIYFGAKADPGFECVKVNDGDEIRVGGLRLRFLETPGHTPESICVVMFLPDRPDVPECVFTGDTLFVGDVGRPDLLGARMSAEELASMMYDSLHSKIMTLPDETKVFPAHGAGSLCGRNISTDTSSTIGHQRRFNYALQPMEKSAFVAAMTADLPEAPRYFGTDAGLNRTGPALMSELVDPVPLSPSEVESRLKEGAVVLDTRSSEAYGAGHIPNAIHISLSGQFASWAGSLVDPAAPLIILADNEDREAEARLRLARVGLENVVGYASGGFEAWDLYNKPVRQTEQITVEELEKRLQNGTAGQLIDVRRPAEWSAGHIDQATHIPLNLLETKSSTVDRSTPVTVICAGGFRSSAASSILERQGFAHVTNVTGGMSAWNQMHEKSRT